MTTSVSLILVFRQLMFGLLRHRSFLQRNISRGETGFGENLEIGLPVEIFGRNFICTCSLMCFGILAKKTSDWRHLVVKPKG